jgi:hypothetical protein
MFRNVMIAAALATGFAGAAAAYDVRVLSQGESFAVERLGDDGSTVVGGASLRVTANGENFTTEVVGTPLTQAPAISRVVGNGAGQTIEFFAPRG